MHDDGLLQVGGDDLPDGPFPVAIGLEQLRDVLLYHLELFFRQDARVPRHVQDILLVFWG